MYTQYTEHFYNLKDTGFQYKKYNIKILGKNLELDYFLSFTEFKKILIKELFDLDTDDIIQYGYDIYIFTIFNVYLWNSIKYEITSRDFTCFRNTVVNRSLINIIQPFIGKLGWHYPSRNEMYGYIYISWTLIFCLI